MVEASISYYQHHVASLSCLQKPQTGIMTLPKEGVDRNDGCAECSRFRVGIQTQIIASVSLPNTESKSGRLRTTVVSKKLL